MNFNNIERILRSIVFTFIMSVVPVLYIYYSVDLGNLSPGHILELFSPILYILSLTIPTAIAAWFTWKTVYTNSKLSLRLIRSLSNLGFIAFLLFQGSMLIVELFFFGVKNHFSNNIYPHSLTNWLGLLLYFTILWVGVTVCGVAYVEVLNRSVSSFRAIKQAWIKIKNNPIARFVDGLIVIGSTILIFYILVKLQFVLNWEMTLIQPLIFFGTLWIILARFIRSSIFYN